MAPPSGPADGVRPVPEAFFQTGFYAPYGRTAGPWTMRPNGTAAVPLVTPYVIAVPGAGPPVGGGRVADSSISMF